MVNDGENRPVSVTAFGTAASFDYGPDGERSGKSFVGARHVYLGADSEVLFGQAAPQPVVTSWLHPDIKREGQATDVMVKDHLASNRLALRVGAGTIRSDYGPYGQPLTSNGSVPLQDKEAAEVFFNQARRAIGGCWLRSFIPSIGSRRSLDFADEIVL